jgi:hypothetical protein
VGAVSSETVIRNCDNIVEDQAFCSQNETIREPVGGGGYQQVNAGTLDSGSEEKLSRDCWTKPAIKRAVILIIDALRYINITMLDVVI